MTTSGADLTRLAEIEERLRLETILHKQARVTPDQGYFDRATLLALVKELLASHTVTHSPMPSHHMAQSGEMMEPTQTPTPSREVLNDAPDYTAMDGPQLLRACGDSAARWADAFMQIVARGGQAITWDTMMGWFANAIEHSHDVRTGGGPVVLPDGSAFFVATIDAALGKAPSALKTTQQEDVCKEPLMRLKEPAP